MRCKELMTSEPTTCILKDNVAVAADIMWSEDCGAVPVLKDVENQELVGMVTDRDIAMYVVKHANTHPNNVSVEDCMSSPVVSCQENDSVERAMELMGEHRIRRIPVINPDGECVGIISEADLLLSEEVDNDDVLEMLKRISIPHSEE